MGFHSACEPWQTPVWYHLACFLSLLCAGSNENIKKQVSLCALRIYFCMYNILYITQSLWNRMRYWIAIDTAHKFKLCSLINVSICKQLMRNSRVSTENWLLFKSNINAIALFTFMHHVLSGISQLWELHKTFNRPSPSLFLFLPSLFLGTFRRSMTHTHRMECALHYHSLFWFEYWIWINYSLCHGHHQTYTTGRPQPNFIITLINGNPTVVI